MDSKILAFDAKFGHLAPSIDRKIDSLASENFFLKSLIEEIKSKGQSAAVKFLLRQLVEKQSEIRRIRTKLNNRLTQNL